MVIDTRPREWHMEDHYEHADICRALAIAGHLRRRCAGLEPHPTTQLGMFRREMPMKLTEFDLPSPNYTIVHRRENQNDIGIYRAYGPAGWTKDFVTPTLAGYGCWDHHYPPSTDPEEE